MTTRGPLAGLPMRPPQTHVIPVSAPPSRARSVQATTATSHHPRSHTQRPTPPSKVAQVRSWIDRKKRHLGAAISILAVIVTVISLLPSFAGSRYGKATLELALWTAKKDYVEACQMVSSLEKYQGGGLLMKSSIYQDLLLVPQSYEYRMSASVGKGIATTSWPRSDRRKVSPKAEGRCTVVKDSVADS